MKSKLLLLSLILIATLSISCSKIYNLKDDLNGQQIYSVTIITQPTGGDIYMNEELKGTSPITLDMTLADVLEVRAKKGNLESIGEQSISFKTENKAILTVLLSEIQETKYPGSSPIIIAEIDQCKTARTIANAQYWPEVDYSHTGSIYFVFDKAKLTPESHKVLDELAPHIYAAYKSGMLIAIEGHTDSTGENEYNFRLSGQRVQAVVDYFTSHKTYPIPEKYLWIKGWGETCPLSNNSTSEGRSENRRTDIILLPISAITELPE